MADNHSDLRAASEFFSTSDICRKECTKPHIIEQSLIQTWERQQDLHIGQPHVDVLDAWSSDGDSVSSSSSIDLDLIPDRTEVIPNAEGDELPDMDSNQDSVDMNFRRNVNLLKRAGVYTGEEMIDQAINRWESYISLCSRSIHILRQQLIDAYIPHALEQSKVVQEKSTGSQVQNGSFKTTTQNKRKQRALKRMLHHSVKTENQRHLACVSKFALVSNRIAKWHKSTASQQCLYRDPTTTTWEKHCTNQCLPLLPVCAYHLVQLKPAPASSTNSVDTMDSHNITNSSFNIASDTNCLHSSSNDLDPSSKKMNSSLVIQTTTFNNNTTSSNNSNVVKIAKLEDYSKTTSASRQTRSGKGHTDSLVHYTTTHSGLPTLQLPNQYLFRRCGGGPDNNCPEPVIAWNSSTHCINHTTLHSVCLGHN